MVKIALFGLLAAALLAGDAVLAQNAAIPLPQVPVPTPAATTSSPSSPALPNWVGALKGKPIDTACYRKSYIAKSKKCGTGYNFDKVATCWAQCPIEYPVECGMECIPQNKDCTKQVLRKIGSVANVALSLSTSGVFGQLSQAAKGVQQGVKCGQQLFNAVNKVVGYIDEVENGAAVDTTKEQLLYLLSKSDFVVYDLPVAVTTCLGMPAPTGSDQIKQVVDTVKTILDQVLTMKTKGINLLDINNFLAMTAAVPAVGKPISALSPKDGNALKDLISSGVKCGPDVKSVIDKIVASVQELKTLNPANTVDVIKFAVLNSDLVLKELPAVAASCVGSTTGFTSRDDILKTVHVIIDQVVAASSQNGNPISADKYAITIANMGLDAIAMIDPTGIAAMAQEFIQPICGPTAYIGDIDDGPAEQALGLTTVEKAFRGTTGSWAKQADSQLRLTFTSVDDKDVKVNVFSGGLRVYQVKVGKGQTVEWSKPLSEFHGKTLYMDRWRPGFLGIPGTGGGSVSAWVPNDTDGGLQLSVKINPTSFSDHALRH